MCDVKTKSFDELELHLFTYEVYSCQEFIFKVKTLKELKQHMDDSHYKSGYFEHLIMHIAKPNEVSANLISITSVQFQYFGISYFYDMI